MSYMKPTASQQAASRAASQQRRSLAARELEKNSHPAFMAGGRTGRASHRASSATALNKSVERARSTSFRPVGQSVSKPRVDTAAPRNKQPSHTARGESPLAKDSSIAGGSFVASSCFSSRAVSGGRLGSVSKSRGASPVVKNVHPTATTGGNGGKPSGSTVHAKSTTVAAGTMNTAMSRLMQGTSSSRARSTSQTRRANTKPTATTAASNREVTPSPVAPPVGPLSRAVSPYQRSPHRASPPPTPIASQKLNDTSSPPASPKQLNLDLTQEEKEPAVSREKSPARDGGDSLFPSHSRAKSPARDGIDSSCYPSHSRAKSPVRDSTTSPSKVRSLLRVSIGAVSNIIGRVSGAISRTNSPSKLSPLQNPIDVDEPSIGATPMNYALPPPVADEVSGTQFTNVANGTPDVVEEQPGRMTVATPAKSVDEQAENVEPVAAVEEADEVELAEEPLMDAVSSSEEDEVEDVEKPATEDVRVADDDDDVEEDDDGIHDIIRDSGVMVEISPMTDDGSARRSARLSAALDQQRTSARPSDVIELRDSAVIADLGGQFDTAASTVVEPTPVEDESKKRKRDTVTIAEVEEASDTLSEKRKKEEEGTTPVARRSGTITDVSPAARVSAGIVAGRRSNIFPSTAATVGGGLSPKTPFPTSEAGRTPSAAMAATTPGSGNIADRVHARIRKEVDYDLDDKILKWYTTPRRKSTAKTPGRKSSARKSTATTGRDSITAAAAAEAIGAEVVAEMKTPAPKGRKSGITTTTTTTAPSAKKSAQKTKTTPTPVPRVKTPGKNLLAKTNSPKTPEDAVVSRASPTARKTATKVERRPTPIKPMGDDNHSPIFSTTRAPHNKRLAPTPPPGATQTASTKKKKSLPPLSPEGASVGAPKAAKKGKVPAPKDAKTKKAAAATKKKKGSKKTKQIVSTPLRAPKKAVTMKKVSKE